jgi:hypothetical protein
VNSEFNLVVTDAASERAITSMRAEDQLPASVALLVDGSGSMSLVSATVSQGNLRDVLANLRQNDLAALMSFDTRLLTLRQFTGSASGFGRHGLSCPGRPR